MMLIDETTVPDGALPVEEFKAHLRLGSGFDGNSLQDDVLRSFLRAALSAVEARTGKALISRSFSYTLSEWGDAQGQVLPVAPVVAIDAITATDRTGTEAILPVDGIWLERDQTQPRVRPIGAALPAVPGAGTVSVAFTAGYGPAWSDVPADLQQAVMLLAAHYYEYRDETGLSEGCMPFGVTSLLERYRFLRISGGRRS
ncbi:MAG: head-tail connector protein [Pseudomonadota bacterium]